MRRYVRVPLIERLEEKIMPLPWSGCWIYLGGDRSSGYGAIKDNDQRMTSAHIASYKTYVGAVPKGMFVCHRCDVPSCVNPAHLFLGTHAENMKDRNNKGRQARQRGELQGGAKLTWGQVRAIRASSSNGIELANLMGVSQATISNVLNGHRWVIENYVRTHRRGNTKVRPDVVTKIKNDVRSQREIAKSFGICQQTVSKIKRGLTWRGGY